MHIYSLGINLPGCLWFGCGFSAFYISYTDTINFVKLFRNSFGLSEKSLV